jgi:hypothetical protein
MLAIQRLKKSLSLSQSHTDSDEKTPQQTSCTIFTFGLKVLSLPPLTSVASQLKLSAKEKPQNKNFHKAL